jgi:hypothetical protein
MNLEEFLALAVQGRQLLLPLLHFDIAPRSRIGEIQLPKKL